MSAATLWFSLRRAPSALAAAALFLLIALAAALAPWIAPQNPFDLAQLDLMNALLPPAWLAGGEASFLLGSDDQGRDLLSAILHGARLSLAVGLASVLLAMAIGVTLGLAAGYLEGPFGALVMRLADVQLTFPALLTALLIDGIARGVLPRGSHDALWFPVLVLAIGLAAWPQYARTLRATTLVEKGKDYVQAARLLGQRPGAILFRQILPNVAGPVVVLATVQLAVAILTEATLSFLGIGVPATSPSLGTLIRIGSDFLFSGEWWVMVFPGAALVLLTLAVNLLGDWLRDLLDPRLR